MDRSFTLPRSMKRCSSLSDISFGVGGGGGGGRKSSKESYGKQKVATKVYRGRLSLGRPAGGTAARIQRRKSNNKGGGRYVDDFDDEYYSKYTDDMHLTPSPSVTTFRCLPVIERETSSTSSTNESRKSSEVSLLGLAPFSVLCSIQQQPEPPADERLHLFQDISRFLNADRNAKTSKLVVDQQKAGDEHYLRMFTIGSKKEKHKYGDVLWLILKAYFSGREVSGGQDSTFEEDTLVCKKRESQWSIIEKVMNYSAIPFVQRSYNLDAGYMTHIADVRRTVHDLLEDLDHYQSLFPNRRSMVDFVSTRMNQQYASTLFERVDVLTAWLTTVDDLVDKLRVLGEVFEVDRLTNAHSVWPRPLLRSTTSICLQDARPVFQAYVGRSLNLKGMKKVLTRVWGICETSVVKAALLLHLPPKTYAQAASGSNPHLILSDDMKRRYDSEGTATSRFGVSNDQYRQMQLPTFVPLFCFLLGVRVELVLEWLSIRVSSTLPSELDSQVDTLTLETMIEDSRDCVEEAVRVKRHYMSVVQATCPGSRPYPEEFDTSLKGVFKNYLLFISCWAHAVSARGDLRRLFSHLESEWAAAVVAARSIHSGVEDLTTTFATLVPHLLDSLILGYWEQKWEWITEEHSVYDMTTSTSSPTTASTSDAAVAAAGALSDDDIERDDDWSMVNSPRDNPIFVACREHNRLIREIKDRSARIYSLLRGALSDLHDAVGYLPRISGSGSFACESLAQSLQTHCLVDLGSGHASMPVSVFVDARSADTGTVDEVVAALAEGRPIEKGHGHVVTVPGSQIGDVWTGRRVKTSVDDEMLLSLRYLRSDVVCVVGDFVPDQHLFDPIMPACSSNDIVDGQLKGLMSTLVDHSERVWDLVGNMWSIFELDCAQRKMKDYINSTIQHAFTLVFQLHREIIRFVSDSCREYFAQGLIQRSLRIVEKWRDLVVLMRPAPASSIPVWASHAFNFIVFLAEPKWTNLLTEEDFQDLCQYVSDCKELVVSPGSSFNATEAASVTRRKSSFASRSTTSANSHHESRRVQLKEAAERMDKAVVQRQSWAAVGKVIETKPEKFVSIDPTRKPPFKWQILEKIGSGQFADVYKALNVDDQCVVAVKKIRINKKLLKTVEGEIDIFRNLNHPNLVKYHGFQLIQDEVHILMEFCAEGTLERICREGLDMTLVRMYTNSMLQAISYMHKHKVVHRDIKPANIFLDFRCRLKLGDFGCSVRLLDAATMCGELAEYVGTPQYMAPEIQTYGGMLADGTYRGYGRAVDIWSVGCVVLQMVTGRLPWSEETHPYQITMKVCTGEKPKYPPNATAILKGFLDACLEYKPEDRKSADALLQDPFANIHVDVESVCSGASSHPDPVHSPISPLEGGPLLPKPAASKGIL